MPTDDERSAYTVMVDDNFHYMDEDDRHKLGSFATLEEAVAACRAVVETSLKAVYKPGISAEALLDHYKSFGEDPFIQGPPGAPAPVGFSGWDYARAHAETMCASNTQS